MPTRRRDEARITSSPAGLTRAERLKNRLRLAAAAAAVNDHNADDDNDDNDDDCDIKNDNNTEDNEEAHDKDDDALYENPYVAYRARKIARNEQRLRDLGLPVSSHSSSNNVGVDDVEEDDSIDNDPHDENYVNDEDNVEDDDDEGVDEEDDDNGGGKLPPNSSMRVHPGSGLYYSDDDAKMDEVFDDDYNAKYFSSIPSEDVQARRRTRVKGGPNLPPNATKKEKAERKAYTDRQRRSNYAKMKAAHKKMSPHIQSG